MIIVDDRGYLDCLAGQLPAADAGVVATTWGFHYRLLRALSDESRVGRLTGASTSASAATLRRLAVEPSRRRTVLDPRLLTETAATLAVRHGLNLLAAELVAAATVHRAPVRLDSRNVGRSWPQVFAAEGLELQLVGR